MDDQSEHVLEYILYWLSIYVVLNLNDILGRSIFPWTYKWCTAFVGFSHFLIICEYWIITFSRKGNLDNTTNVIWCWRICSNANEFPPITLMCLFLLKMYLFSWIFVIKRFLYLRAVMTWILLNLSLICWLDIDTITCRNVVGFFITMVLIHKLVLFVAGKARYMGYYFTTGIHRTCCDSNSIGKLNQWE